MPPFIRALAMILIGVPGGILWLVGMVSFLFMCWNLRKILDSPGIEEFLYFAGSVAASAIGFAMVAAAEILGGAKRYRMPARRLLSYLGWELLEGFLAVAMVGITLAATSSLAAKELAAGAFWTSMGIVDAFLLAATHRGTMKKGKKWRAELIPQPPPADWGTNA